MYIINNAERPFLRVAAHLKERNNIMKKHPLTPEQYLKHVLLKWETFNNSHPYLHDSILILLLENTQLKRENAALRKEQRQ